MQKLVAHLIVAAGLWFGLGHFGVSPLWRAAAIVGGAFAVHLIWERLFCQPFVHLGARGIDPDDPLMKEARRLAAETMPALRALFPEHPHDTVVRFGLRVKSGKTEFVWGDLLELSDSTAKVFLRTPPTEEADIPDRTLTILVADIDDWQVEFRDGTLRGGFTNRAVFRITEREEDRLHPTLREELQRYRDI